MDLSLIVLHGAVLVAAAGLDVGAVLYTRSVQVRSMLVGSIVTAIMAAAQFLPLLVAVDDPSVIYSAVVGHVIGYNIGMRIPMKDRAGS